MFWDDFESEVHNKKMDPVQATYDDNYQIVHDLLKRMYMLYQNIQDRGNYDNLRVV